MSVRLQPEKNIFIGQNVTKSFAGIPYEWGNVEEKRILWRKTTNINEDFQVGMRRKYNSSQIVANIDFDFTQRIYDIRFYGWLDIMSKLGGLWASVLPIMNWIFPLFMLHFLHELSVIIDDQMHINQEKEMVSLMEIACK